MMKKESIELKVGIFVMLALAALSVLVFKAGDFYLKPGYNIRLVFDYVSGIEKGSPAHLAGVQVGEVTSIRVVRDADGVTKVELGARIHQGIFIEEDAEARISTLGLLGEKYVEILPGTSGAKTISDGSTLIGQAPIVLEKITQSGNRLILKIEDAVDNINKVVKDPEFQSSVKKTFANSEKTFGHGEIAMKNLVEITEDLKDTAKSAKLVMARLRDGQGTIGKLLTEDKIAKELEDFVKDIKAHPWKLLKKS